MDMVKWFVYFIGRHGEQLCHCFEDDEHQARHFASLVNGEIALEINGRKVEIMQPKVAPKSIIKDGEENAEKAVKI